MIESVRRAIRRHDRSTFAGLACGVVPLAVIVHLGAEFAAAGSLPDADFLLRHVYMVPLVAGALVAFAATLGLGHSRAERVRRCAFARAALRRLRGGAGVRNLFVLNLAFFAATQALEGAPIAAGSLALGLTVAAAGSLLASLAVFAFGRRLVIAIEIACASRRIASPRATRAARRVRAPRRAARTFSLFIPNRPPPALSLG